jgi:hypothetical protein
MRQAEEDGAENRIGVIGGQPKEYTGEGDQGGQTHEAECTASIDLGFHGGGSLRHAQSSTLLQFQGCQ